MQAAWPGAVGWAEEVSTRQLGPGPTWLGRAMESVWASNEISAGVKRGGLNWATDGNATRCRGKPAFVDDRRVHACRGKEGSKTEKAGASWSSAKRESVRCRPESLSSIQTGAGTELERRAAANSHRRRRLPCQRRRPALPAGAAGAAGAGAGAGAAAAALRCVCGCRCVLALLSQYAHQLHYLQAIWGGDTCRDAGAAGAAGAAAACSSRGSSRMQQQHGSRRGSKGRRQLPPAPSGPAKTPVGM